MATVIRDGERFLYRQVVDLVADNIDSGTLRPGDKLPSLRRMSRQLSVSVPTVRQAYVELERQRRVESRAKSGFYVRNAQTNEVVRPAPALQRNAEPVSVSCRPLMDRVYDGLYRPDSVPLGIANPCLAFPAARQLHRTMKRVMTRIEARALTYAPTMGEPALRRQIAYRYLDTVGSAVDADDVCITNGGQEALLLALRAVADAGDVIAVESPAYHGVLELIDSLGMLAIEVETCAEEGVMLDALERTLDAHPVRACVLSTTLSNPLGVSMPPHKREALLQLLEARDTALIDDDVYGDLRFDGQRPRPAEALTTGGRVLTCGSFSKTAAPGYRIGWLLARRYRAEVERLKRSYSCSSGLLQQLTLTEFLASGDYERYLRKLRPVLQRNAERMTALVAQHFPPDTRTSRPVGGSVLWLELPGDIDAEKLFDDALAAGISIAPGHIFTPRPRYTNAIRLSFGHPWSSRIETAIAWLGAHAHALSRT